MKTHFIEYNIKILIIAYICNRKRNYEYAVAKYILRQGRVYIRSP